MMRQLRLLGFALLLLAPYLMMVVLTSLQLWEVEEDNFNSEMKLLIEDGSPIAQSITPRYPNLFRIDVFLGKNQPHLQGGVNLQVISSVNHQTVLASGFAMATPYVIDGIYPFIFSPPINAIGHTLLISLTTTTNVSVMTLGSMMDVYPDGQLFTNTHRQAQDLAFRLYYRPGALTALRETGWAGALRAFALENLYQAMNQFGITPVFLLVIALYFLGLVKLSWGLGKHDHK